MDNSRFLHPWIESVLNTRAQRARIEEAFTWFIPVKVQPCMVSGIMQDQRKRRVSMKLDLVALWQSVLSLRDQQITQMSLPGCFGGFRSKIGTLQWQGMVQGLRSSLWRASLLYCHFLYVESKIIQGDGQIQNIFLVAQGILHQPSLGAFGPRPKLPWLWRARTSPWGTHRANTMSTG